MNNEVKIGLIILAVILLIVWFKPFSKKANVKGQVNLQGIKTPVILPPSYNE